MNDIVEALCLIIACLGAACCVGYLKGWCCDGGIVAEFQSTKNKLERKIRKQIKKMVETEKEIKRLALIATSGTDEDPNEYIAKIRHLQYPHFPHGLFNDPHYLNPEEDNPEPIEIQVEDNVDPDFPIYSQNPWQNDHHIALSHVHSNDSANNDATINRTTSRLLLDYNRRRYQLASHTPLDLELDFPEEDPMSNAHSNDELPPSYDECMQGLKYAFV